MIECKLENVKRAIELILGSFDLDSIEIKELVDYFLTVDMCGVSTHGLMVFKAIVNKLENKEYDLKKHDLKIIKKNTTFTVFDAQNTVGYLSAVRCVRYAIEMSGQNGLYTVFCRGANTFGAAFYYTLLAVKCNKIGIAMSNSPAAMAPYGGKKTLLGTNPIAIGIPTNKNNPILFDMASSVVSKSKINEARKNGESIPLGWALNKCGEPTTDPEEAINGSLLPVGGPKGYGISLCIDVLSGLISGSSYLNGVNKFYSSNSSGMNVGHTFIILDPAKIYSPTFYDMIDGYIDELKKDENGNGEVRYPGELKMKCFDYNNRNGVVLLSQNIIDDINGILRKKNLGMLI